MNHPSDDALLLLAYGELDGAARDAAARHLATCEVCGRRFDALERARVALEWTIPSHPHRVRRWAVIALAAAAGIVLVLLGHRSPTGSPSGWPPTRQWSATAGYLAGGPAVITIDAQLTRLEQEWSYVHP